jgi:hypothetical protein
VQRVAAPTRDIYVERKMDGDRVFAGFGRPSQEYCDCFLDPDKLPEDILKVGGGARCYIQLSYDTANTGMSSQRCAAVAMQHSSCGASLTAAVTGQLCSGSAHILCMCTQPN